MRKMKKKKKKRGENRMTEVQEDEVEAIVDEYLEESQHVRDRVCDRIAKVIMQNPLAKDEILYTLARSAGSDIAIDVSRGLRKRMEESERQEAKADLYRKYEEVISRE